MEESIITCQHLQIKLLIHTRSIKNSNPTLFWYLQQAKPLAEFVHLYRLLWLSFDKINVYITDLLLKAYSQKTEVQDY